MSAARPSPLANCAPSAASEARVPDGPPQRGTFQRKARESSHQPRGSARPILAICLAALVGGALSSTAAIADSHSRTPADPAFLSECGTCHVPYPPRLLSAASWRTLMNDLGRHFGTDASVDPATGRSILAYLEANAGSGRKVSDDPRLVRVTRSPRFLHKHDEIPPAVFRGDKVKSAANCGACHPQAQHGRFGEHDVHIPR